MSLSSLIEQQYLPRVSVLQAVADKYHLPRSRATTLEQQVAIEAEALETYRAIVEGDTWINEVTAFDHPDKLDFETAYGTYELMGKANALRLGVLMKILLDRKNSQAINTTELVGQLRRIRQKLAVLNLWEDQKTKYFVANRFLSTEGLDSKFISLDACAVNTSQGLLTLPVQSKQLVTVSNIRVGSQSNGQAGSSDVDITLGNQNLQALIRADSVDSFEYERLDGGPCNLTLVLELSKPQVVNVLSIQPIDIGAGVSFQVEDIVFTTSTKQSVSIHELLSLGENKDAFVVSVASLGEPWELSFLPVEAVSISISLTQTQSYQLEVASPDGVVFRERFAIPLKYIGVSQVTYKQQGGINSVPTGIRKNLYAVEPVINVSPNNYNLYDLVAEVSFNDGTTWKTVGTEEAGVISLISRNDRTFLWRVALTRNDPAFSTFTSYFQGDAPVGELKTLLKTVSRFNSPTVISLTSPPVDANIHVIQPKVARRGSKDRALRLGTVGYGVNKLRMPFRPFRHGLKPSEVKIHVNGVEYLRREAGTPISAQEWSFTDDHEQVMLGPDLPAGTPVDLVVDEELLLLEEREDGYYHKMRLGFDPEKKNLKINSLAREPSRGSVVLEHGRKVIPLGVKNILEDTVTLTSTGGAVYTEVNTRDDVFDNEDGDYYVDYVNGILYLADFIADDDVRASYDYQVEEELQEDHFDIVYEAGIPWGVKISKSFLEASEFTEVIADDLRTVLGILTGETDTRVEIIPVGSSKKKLLSATYVIKGSFNAPVDLLQNDLLPEEVPYVDGVSEFLGLTEVTNELTNAIDADEDGVVQFALAGRGLWYQPLGLTASNTNVFANPVAGINEVTSGDQGDYFVDTDGTAYVQISPSDTLPADIRLGYYVKDSLFEPANKFSVNYQDGVLYAYSALNQQAEVVYKSAAYKAAYDISVDVPFVYDSTANAVQVNTENLNPANNLLKVMWVEQPIAQVSQQLAQYFSPLVSLVGFRFS